jgi:hypothetical protein
MRTPTCTPSWSAAAAAPTPQFAQKNKPSANVPTLNSLFTKFISDLPFDSHINLFNKAAAPFHITSRQPNPSKYIFHKTAKIIQKLAQSAKFAKYECIISEFAL